MKIYKTRRGDEVFLMTKILIIKYGYTYYAHRIKRKIENQNI